MNPGNGSGPRLLGSWVPQMHLRGPGDSRRNRAPSSTPDDFAQAESDLTNAEFVRARPVARCGDERAGATMAGLVTAVATTTTPWARPLSLGRGLRSVRFDPPVVL